MNYTIIKKVNFYDEEIKKQTLINAVIATIKMFMSEKSHTFIDESELEGNNLDFVFSIGGDGTMMHSVNSLVGFDPLFIGINAGNVGFLTAYEPSDIFNGQVFEDLFSHARIEKRSLVEYQFQDKIILSANEIALYPPKINQVVDFSMEIQNNQCEKFRPAGDYQANTLLLSSPMGSTAYNKNAGGAIIDPNMNAIQFTLVAPTLEGTHPVVFGEETLLKVIANRDLVILSDGMETTKLKKGDFFLAKVAKSKARLLLPEEWNFFSLLAKKLHWNNGKTI